MTLRTHEIAHALQMAGLAGMPNLVKLAEWIDKYATADEERAQRDGMRLAYTEILAKANVTTGAQYWANFAELQLANLDRMEGSGT